jgi:hypothetical protein
MVAATRNQKMFSSFSRACQRVYYALPTYNRAAYES